MAAADYTNAVQQLYVSYFGRPADTTGLANFTAALNAMVAPTTVAAINAQVQAGTNPALSALVNGFSTSAESIALYGAGTSTLEITQFVTAIYGNVLDRAPDAGANFWIDAIVNGTLTLADAALSITAGALVNTSAQGLLDAQTVANKVAVATNFTIAIDTPAEVAAFSGDVAAAAARAMLALVDNTTNVTTFQTTVEETLALIVDPTAPVTLTTSLVALTAANDAVTAFLDASGAQDAFLATANDVNGVGGVTAADANYYDDGADGVPDAAANAKDVVAFAVVEAGGAIEIFAPAYDTTASAGVRAAQIVDIQTDLNAALVTAKSGAVAATTAINAFTGLKALADKAVATQAVLDAAIVALAAVDLAAVEALAAADVYSDLATVPEINSYAYLTQDPVTNVYSVTTTAASLITAGLTAAEAAAYLPVLAKLATAANNQFNADAAATLADAKDAAADTAVTDYITALPDADEAGATTVLNTYLTADAGITTAEENLATFADLLADLAAANADLTTLEGLDATAANAAAAVEAAGFALTQVLDTGDYNTFDTDGADVFVLGADLVFTDTATITNFGALENDALYLGTGFTLNAGVVADDGVDSVLEIFFEQDGANTIVHIETAAFGSNAFVAETVQITLVGTDAADLTFSSGYIQLA